MKVTIVLPTYNEAENLKPLASQIIDVVPCANILIVDDNSPDGTGLIADELAKANQQIKVLHRAKKEGLGRAYIEAFKYLFSTDTDYIITMDADFSHDPQYLPVFLGQIKDYDLVIGSRYLGGNNVVNWPLYRLILSSLANYYARKMIGIPINDFTSGFTCCRKNILKKLDFSSIKSSGYAFLIEIKYRLVNAGARYKEIPIMFVERRNGCSKISKRIICEAFFRVLKLRLSSSI